MATSTGKKRKDPPRIMTRSRGRITETLEGLAEQYEEANPGMKCRWVYSPEHKPELSNVISRKAQGYKTVTGELHPNASEMLGLEDSEPVRVGDLILMAVPKEIYEQIRRELEERAQSEAERVNEEFYDEVEKISTAGMRSEHKPRPRGRAVIEEREFEFDVEQGTSTEE